MSLETFSNKSYKAFPSGLKISY